MAMHWISKETYDLIAAAASSDFNPSGQSRPDGSWDVELSDITMVILHSHMLPGESVDNAIGRFFRSRPGNFASPAAVHPHLASADAARQPDRATAST